MTDPSTRQSGGPREVTALLTSFLAYQPGAHQPPPLRYLRRKPGRGLVAVYGSARDPEHLYTVSVAEAALDGEGVGNRDDTARWQGNWPGLITHPERAVAIQAFPSDERMPALAAVMRPADQPVVWNALEVAGSAVLPGGDNWQLVGARAEPIRYKPGDRCVIRYELHLLQEAPNGRVEARTSVVGKVYRDAADATAADAVLRRLHGSGMHSWCAEPLGTVDSLGLVLTEDLAQRHPAERTAGGTDVIRPGSPHCATNIAAAASALAQVHMSGAAAGDTPLRRGADEAAKAERRGRTLCDHLPALAPRVSRTAAAVSDRLRQLEPAQYRPGHGSYKPSQLLVSATSVFLIDFDQFCRADPALDVGYFLAYLRPPALFHRRPGSREWFDRAAATFRDAYQVAMARHGAPSAEIEAILSRSAVYEAALLLKIGARRANRLQSPRAGEIEATLQEVVQCLAAAER